MSEENTKAFIHYLLHDACPILPDAIYLQLVEDEAPARLAKCFVTLYPSTFNEENRAVFTYLHPDRVGEERVTSLLTVPSSMEIPMVKDDKGYLLNWIEVTIVLLPDIPLRILVREPSLPQHNWIDM